MSTISRSKLLVAASLVLLIATGCIVVRYGQSAYFVAFHKPFHLSLKHAPTKYTPPVLPSFQVQPAISSRSLVHGSTQHITVTVSPDRTVTGYVEVWIESPEHRQVFRNPLANDPARFVGHTKQTFSYSYPLPKTLSPGTYTVSAIITSANGQTDYYVNVNFATFTVS